MSLASTDTGAFATSATARQLRILHVINSTRPEGGGPIEAIRQAAAAMAARGHLTEIACLDVRSDKWLADVPAKVTPTRADADGLSLLSSTRAMAASEPPQI